MNQSAKSKRRRSSRLVWWCVAFLFLVGGILPNRRLHEHARITFASFQQQIQIAGGNGGRATAIHQNRTDRVAIVDCVMYNGEAILPFRIAALYHVVDLFVVTEAAWTFQGTPKAQLYKDTNAALLRPFAEKIEWVIVQDDVAASSSNTTTAWQREAQQRVAPAARIRELHETRVLAHPFVVIASDADEIPDPEVLAQFQPGGVHHAVVTTRPAYLVMSLFMYNLNWKAAGKEAIWRRPHSIPGKLLLSGEVDLNQYRFPEGPSTEQLVDIPHGGHHIRYGAAASDIRRVMESFSETKYNKPDLKSWDNIQSALTTGTDVLRRPAHKSQPWPHFDYTEAPRHLHAVHEALCQLQGVNPSTGLSLSPLSPSSSVDDATIKEDGADNPGACPDPLPIPSATNSNATRVTIIDCTLYNGEPLLPFRVAALYPVVDWFYITEGVYTYQKTRKTEFFKDMNAHLFAPFKDKIRWLMFEMENVTGQRTWDLENEQRSYPARQILSDLEKGIISHPIVVVNTDADEMPHPDVVANFQKGGMYHNKVTREPVLFNMQNFKYNFNWIGGNSWSRGHTIPGDWIVKKKANLLQFRGGRKKFPKMAVLPNSGYHLSYGFSVEGIRRKLESFAHSEFNLEHLKSEENIQHAVSTGFDVLQKAGQFSSHFDYRRARKHIQPLHEVICQLQQVNITIGVAQSASSHYDSRITTLAAVHETYLTTIALTYLKS